MQRLASIAILLAALTAGIGCSEETVQDVQEAGRAAGEAAESAAKDTAENTRKAAGEVEEALEGDDPE